MKHTIISSFSEPDTHANLSLATTSELSLHLLAEARATLETGAPLHLTLPINATDYAVGSQLATAIAHRYGDRGLPEGTVSITFHGNAGQSFGVFNTAGIELTLIGEAGDHVGREMSGGQIVVRPSLKSQLRMNNGLVGGHSVLEGATGGSLFVAGQVGDRFAVANGGSTAVVEGIGNHGCAEMTDGVVVVLGHIGDGFAGGLNGGLVFVLDEARDLPQRLHPEAVQPERVTQAADMELLKHLIKRHVRLTGSVRGQTILDSWPNRLGMFWKIAPQDAVNSTGGQSVIRESLPMLATG